MRDTLCEYETIEKAVQKMGGKLLPFIKFLQNQLFSVKYGPHTQI